MKLVAFIIETRESAEKYKDMHTNRMAGFGINYASMKVFEINEKMTQITKGPKNNRRLT